MAGTLYASNLPIDFFSWLSNMFHLAETVIVGLALNDLAERMHVENALQLHNLFLGRAIGAVFGTWAAWCAMLGAWERRERDHNEKTYWDILRYYIFGIIWICVHHSSCACSYIFRWSTSHCFEPRHNARRMALRRVSHQAGHELLYWQLLRTNWLLWNRTKHQNSNESRIFVVELQLVFWCFWCFRLRSSSFFRKFGGSHGDPNGFISFAPKLWRGSALSVIAVPFSASTGNAWVLQLGLFFRPKNGGNWSASRLCAFEMRQWHQGVFKLSHKGD